MDFLHILLIFSPQDIIAQSQSGTGKTATFLLAMLQRLNPSQKEPQCIVVAPTFELAQQIGDVAKQMAAYLPDVQIRFAVKGESGFFRIFVGIFIVNYLIKALGVCFCSGTLLSALLMKIGFK